MNNGDPKMTETLLSPVPPDGSCAEHVGFQYGGVTALVDCEIQRLKEQPGGKINSDQRREVPEGEGGFRPELSRKVKEDAHYRWRHGSEKGRLGT